MKLYCSYQDCKSVRETFSAITFFQIPKEDHRRQLWIRNSGNPYLKSLKATSKCFFCEKHFDPKMIRRQFDRTTLNKFAVPIKYGETLSEQNEPDSTKTMEEPIPTTYEILLLNEAVFESNLNIEEPENYKVKENEEIIKVSLEKNETKLKHSSNSSSKQIKRKLKDSSPCEDNVKIRVLNNNKNEEDTKRKLAVADNYQIINDFNFEDESLSSAFCFELNKNDDFIELNTGISNDDLTDELNPETYNIISADPKPEKIYENEVPETEPQKVESVAPETKQKGCTCREGEKESDKYFLLSLLDNFQRLSYQKKTIAKIKILQYLNNLESNDAELEKCMN